MAARKVFRTVGVLFILLVATGFAAIGFLKWCQLPDHDYRLTVPELDSAGVRIRNNLNAHVQMLAGNIGPRNLNRSPSGLTRAAEYITQNMSVNGFTVRKHTFKVDTQETSNIYALLDHPGADRLLVLGAHYDSFEFSPGADDNASGVAMLIETAKLLKTKPLPFALMIVFFTNEEPPYYETANMGSKRFVAEILSSETRPFEMINFESVGYFSKIPGSQRYPSPLDLIYYSVGDFIGFVSDLGSRDFLKEIVFGFRSVSSFPTGASSLPKVFPGVTWSDHAAFWEAGKSAIMVTDSAPFRYPYYHETSDTPDKLDYTAMTHVTTAMAAVVTGRK